MSLTRVSPALFQVSNNITSVTVGGSANTVSLTFDSNGVITGASNNALSVANTQITGLIEAAQIGSANASLATSGTLPAARLPAGSVLQVVQATTSSALTSTSTTFVSTGFSATITPRSTASRILVQVCTFNFVDRGGANSDFGMAFQMYRDATSVFQPLSNAYTGLYISGTTALSNLRQMQSFCFVDSPSSTSALTYTLYWAGYHIASMNINADPPQTSYIILTEIA